MTQNRLCYPADGNDNQDTGSKSDENSSDIESRHSGQNQDSARAAYFVEAERTYNNSSWVYRLPVDQEEVLRQDRQHYVMLAALPGLYRGPVEEILKNSTRSRRLLDIGCGTGIWVQEIAEAFPNIDCIGIEDDHRIVHSTQLRNCTFMQVNAPSGLRIFGDESFDVINLRQMLHATNQYPDIIKEAFRLLRPGGILLLHEPQLQLHSAWEGFSLDDLAPWLSRMSTLLQSAHQYRNIDTELFSRIDDILIDAGFNDNAIDVYYHYRQACHADLQSEHGQLEAINAISFLYAARLMMLEAGVIDEDGFDELLAGVSEEVRGNSGGIAGPLGAQGMLSPWGYWWALKDDRT